MRNIIINGTNTANTQNNKYVYNFPTGSTTFIGSKVAIQNLTLYYSNFNINASVYNNNQLSYRWIDGTTININIPDGFYTIQNLNLYIQSVMIAQGHYLIDNSGDNQFYLQMQVNSVYYGIQLNELALPAALPVGWSYGTGLSPAWVTSQITAQFIIINNNFTDIIGFNAGTYPTTPQTTNQSQISTYAPQVSPVSTILMKCSLINNNLNIANNVIFCFTPNTTFGSIMSFSPPSLIYMDIKDGQYNNCIIEFVDQDYRPIAFQDPNVTIILSIMDKSDYLSK